MSLALPKPHLLAAQLATGTQHLCAKSSQTLTLAANSTHQSSTHQSSTQCGVCRSPKSMGRDIPGALLGTKTLCCQLSSAGP